MKVQDREDCVGIQVPFFAALDAQRKSQKNEGNWTFTSKQLAVEFKEKVYAAYGNKPRVFLNFRQKFIAIKVAAPTVAEKNLPAVKLLEAEFLKNPKNARKEVAGGIVYEYHP